ncbi:protein SPMIP7 [Engraulis encrasicolus]|uniref:protein SPMIP7 n=1 Tax=Engraulis encrasicolus TaxID=184585 RepID=UPI002FD07548
MSGSLDACRIRLLSRANQSQIGVDKFVHKQLCLPCEKGPEGRFEFESVKEKVARGFIKFNPHAQPPAANAALAPLRDEVLLIDPCSGQLSPGADVDLGNKTTRPQFMNRPYAPSDLWVPTGSRDRPQTPPRTAAAVQYEPAPDKQWNSRALSDAAVRAGIGGWTSAQRVKPADPKTPCALKFFNFFLEKDGVTSTKYSISPDVVDQAARNRIYTSVSQRGYEDVTWDTKLPRRQRPPATTLEKKADAVDQRFTQGRYHTRPELWQAVGPRWNRHQVRSSNDVRKPLSFTSPCPKSGQIPLYCGTIGSKNMDNIDIGGKDFSPLTMLRTTIPAYTPTSHRPTIPGYTGKGHFDIPRASSSTLPALPRTAPVPGARGWRERGSPSAFGHPGPLSRQVTTVPPQNPFLHPPPPVLPITAY